MLDARAETICKLTDPRFLSVNKHRLTSRSGRNDTDDQGFLSFVEDAVNLFWS